jgi:hypothetical protein
MTGPLAALGLHWQDLADGIASMQANMLRRVARQMADGIDRDAQQAIEGARDWRDLAAKRPTL